jgi:hypothetical protein
MGEMNQQDSVLVDSIFFLAKKFGQSGGGSGGAAAPLSDIQTAKLIEEPLRFPIQYEIFGSPGHCVYDFF